MRSGERLGLLGIGVMVAAVLLVGASGGLRLPRGWRGDESLEPARASVPTSALSVDAGTGSDAGAPSLAAASAPAQGSDAASAPAQAISAASAPPASPPPTPVTVVGDPPSTGAPTTTVGSSPAQPASVPEGRDASPSAGSTPGGSASPVMSNVAPRLLPEGAVAPPAPFFALGRPFPAAGVVSRFYPYGTTGGGNYLMHHGVDIGEPYGSVVLSIADGTVVYAGRDAEQAWGPQTDFYGQLVVVRHDVLLDGGPLSSLYGHVSRVLVGDGDRVTAGQPVAEVGSEGIAMGPHLHLEVRVEPLGYGDTRNPELFMAMTPGTGTIVGTLLDAEGRPAPDVEVGLYARVGDQPGDWVGGTTTYPADRVVPSAPWNENFVLADTPPGPYLVVADLGDVHLARPIDVRDGAAWRVTLDVGQALRAEARRQRRASGWWRPAARPGGPSSQLMTPPPD